jgi:hypothetical protein
MCNLWATAVYATALWAIGVAAAIYEPAKRHAGEAWVVTASEKISIRRLSELMFRFRQPTFGRGPP